MLTVFLVGCGGSTSHHDQAATGPNFRILASPNDGTFVRSISNDGAAILGGDSGDGSNRAYLWNREGQLTIVPATSLVGGAAFVSDGSKIIGSLKGAPAIYTIGGSVQTFPVPAGFANAVGDDANNDFILGTVFEPIGTSHPFYVSEDSARLLPELAENSTTQASAISEQGFVVVGYSGDKPVRWTNAATPTISALTQNYGFASDVSRTGSVIVGRMSSGSANVAFRWTEAGGAVALPLPVGCSGADAVAVSEDGNVVVGNGYLATSTSGEARPFVWTKAAGSRLIENAVRFEGAAFGGMTDLKVTALSADGKTMGGYGQYPGGFSRVGRGFVLSLP